MKAKIAGLLAGMVLTLAQTAAAQRAEFGAHLGMALSTVSIKSASGQDATDESNVVGMVGGGFLRFRPGRLGVQTELSFVRKGASVVTLNNGDDLNLKLDYVEVPVLLVVPIAGASPTSAFLYGGPSIALEAGCKGTETSGGTSVHFNCDDTAFDVFDRRQMDVGGTLGAGVRVAMGRGALVADLRYTLGFVNLNKENGDEIRNRSALISVGYSLVSLR